MADGGPGRICALKLTTTLSLPGAPRMSIVAGLAWPFRLVYVSACGNRRNIACASPKGALDMQLVWCTMKSSAAVSRSPVITRHRCARVVLACVLAAGVKAASSVESGVVLLTSRSLPLSGVVLCNARSLPSSGLVSSIISSSTGGVCLVRSISSIGAVLTCVPLSVSTLVDMPALRRHLASRAAFWDAVSFTGGVLAAPAPDLAAVSCWRICVSVRPRRRCCFRLPEAIVPACFFCFPTSSSYSREGNVSRINRPSGVLRASDRCTFHVR